MNISEHSKLAKGKSLEINKYAGKDVFVIECASNFHIRDGSIQKDGSWGRVEITYKELLDFLSYAYLEGLKDGRLDA